MFGLKRGVLVKSWTSMHIAYEIRTSKVVRPKMQMVFRCMSPSFLESHRFEKAP